MPPTRQRDFRGRCHRETDVEIESNPITRIVQEEAEKFLSRLEERLNNDLDESPLGDDDARNVEEIKKDVRAAFSHLLGSKMAVTALGLKRGPSTWNSFYKDNHERKLQELELANSEGTRAYENLSDGSWPKGCFQCGN